MSAYLVSQDTLELIASVLVEWHDNQYDMTRRVVVGENTEQPQVAGFGFDGQTYRLTSRDFTRIVQELYLANARSMNFRYPEYPDMVYYPTPSSPRPVSRDEASYEAAAGALSCFAYQACEFPEWPDSFAFALVEAAKERLVRLIGADHWEFERTAGRAFV